MHVVGVLARFWSPTHATHAHLLRLFFRFIPIRQTRFSVINSLLLPRWGSGDLYTACVIRAKEGEGNAPQMCTPPLPIDDIGMMLGPIDEEAIPNDPNQCGFYFLPYEVAETMAAHYGGVFATDLEVHWPDSAFANAPHRKRAHGKDYALLKKNTLRAPLPFKKRFSGPFPDSPEQIRSW